MKNIIILLISILLAIYSIISIYINDRRWKSNGLIRGPMIK